MIIKTYGLFDKVAEQFVRTFTAKKDADAKRAAKYIVREKDFDPIAGCDYVIYHLYDMDTETGIVVDNTVVSLTALEDAYQEFKAEEKGKELHE